MTTPFELWNLQWIFLFVYCGFYLNEYYSAYLSKILFSQFRIIMSRDDRLRMQSSKHRKLIRKIPNTFMRYIYFLVEIIFSVDLL